MAIRKLKPETEEERRIADRVARARKANPPRDPTGEFHRQCAELARAVGRDPSDVLDDWDHAAAVIQYERGADRATAERDAFDQVRERFTKQKGLDL